MTKAVEYNITYTVETAHSVVIDEERFFSVMNIPLDPATVTGEVIEIFLERTGMYSTVSRTIGRRRTAGREVVIEDAIGGVRP